jgi:hypothetical protein
MLRPVGIGPGKWPGGAHSTNKLQQIERCSPPTRTCPSSWSAIPASTTRNLLEATRLHPGRIAAIYIRDVTDGRPRPVRQGRPGACQGRKACAGCMDRT